MTNKEASNVLRLFANLIEINGLPQERIMTFRKAYEQAISELESDTRSQGEWEIVDAEGLKIWNCVCTECGHDPQEYIGGTEDWWLRKSHLPNFCPNCGVRIVNVKGGAE